MLYPFVLICHGANRFLAGTCTVEHAVLFTGQSGRGIVLGSLRAAKGAVPISLLMTQHHGFPDPSEALWDTPNMTSLFLKTPKMPLLRIGKSRSLTY
ncbi:hypothetical protein PG991_015179 [Apiospora marii]|uniref:Uncharacterized protein n=1 Tax=Apiospora marii TaxID=335849 RepID=A0ABR1R387_9PEZI